MDSTKSKIICLVNALIVRDSLIVPPKFTQNNEDCSEENLIQSFRHVTIEKKQPFFSKCFRLKVSLKTGNFP